jgi:SWI/SNF-related matrix-associated actin-dependent regulator of chromatin subfamily A-like protein 1
LPAEGRKWWRDKNAWWVTGALREQVHQLQFSHKAKLVNPTTANAVTITGDDDTIARQRHIDAFQTDSKTQLILCNIKAAGVGITLTASSRVLFIEFPWTYADCVQCEDRAHRIGQVWPVMCSYLLGIDTIDEKMLDTILTKKDLAQGVTGSTDNMEMSTVDKIINLFNQKNKN